MQLTEDFFNSKSEQKDIPDGLSIIIIKDLCNDLREEINKILPDGKICSLILARPKNKILYIGYKLDDEAKLSENHTKYVINFTNRFFRKKCIKKIRFQIGHCERTSQKNYAESIMLLAKNLARLLNDESVLLKVNQKKSIGEKEIFLRNPFLTAITSEPDLKKLLPEVNKSFKYDDLIILNKCAQTIKQEIKENNKKISESIDNFFKKINESGVLSEKIIHDGNKYTYDADLLFKKILIQNFSFEKTWNSLRYFYTLHEDTKEIQEDLIKKFKILKSKLIVYKKIIDMTKKIFEGIDKIEQIKFLVGFEFLTETEFHDYMDWELNEGITRLNSNITWLDKEIKRLAELVFSFDQFNEINPGFEKNIKLAMYEEKETSINNETTALAIPESYAEKTTITPSTLSSKPENITLNSSTTYIASSLIKPFEASTNLKNLASEYKELVKQKIAAEERRAKAHKDRHQSSQDSSTLNTANKAENFSKNSHEKSLYICFTQKNNTHPDHIKAFLLNGTSHLNLACEGYEEHIFPKDKFKAFQTTVLGGKLLSQDSLGKNGIKIYGLDCLIVKCKKFPAEHLLFIAHRIDNTEDYVYLPHEIISHEKYEKLLNNKNMRVTTAVNAREGVSVTASTKELNPVSISEKLSGKTDFFKNSLNEVKSVSGSKQTPSNAPLNSSTYSATANNTNENLDDLSQKQENKEKGNIQKLNMGQQ